MGQEESYARLRQLVPEGWVARELAKIPVECDLDESTYSRIADVLRRAYERPPKKNDPNE